MDNPQMIHATYQKVLISVNSSYFPWKNIPNRAKASRRIRMIPRPIRSHSSPDLNSDRAIFTKKVIKTLPTMNVQLPKNTLTKNIHKKSGRDTSEWIPGIWFGRTRYGRNFHSGPPLCRKYAIPTHGAASILDTSFTYRITDIDSPSNAISSCPSIGIVHQHVLLESVSGTPGDMSIATGIQRESPANFKSVGCLA